MVVESLASFGADPDLISPDATFEALDIDSLDLAELSQIVHEHFGVELKGADVAEVKTVEDADQADRLAALSGAPRWSPQQTRERGPLRMRHGRSSSRAWARSRRWAWARGRCTSAGARARAGSRTARAHARTSTPRTSSPSRRPAAPTASRSWRSPPAWRRSPTPAGRLGRRTGSELPYAAERVGCVLGTGIGGIATLVDGQDTLRERGREYVSPLSVPLMMSNAGAGALSMRHGLRGPSYAVSSACASGAHAIGSALRMLQSRRSRRGRRRRLGGGPHAARAGGLQRAGRALADRHLAAVRRPPRRLRDGRGRGRARARARAGRARARRAGPGHACAATARARTPTT